MYYATLLEMPKNSGMRFFRPDPFRFYDSQETLLLIFNPLRNLLELLTP